MKINEVIVEGFMNALGNEISQRLGGQGWHKNPNKQFDQVQTAFRNLKNTNPNVTDWNVTDKNTVYAVDANKQPVAVLLKGRWNSSPQAIAQLKQTSPQQAQPKVPDEMQIPPGQRIKVVNPNNNAAYYKTQNGWTNELGQQITNPESIQQLDNMADTGGKQEPVTPPIAQKRQARRELVQKQQPPAPPVQQKQRKARNRKVAVNKISPSTGSPS